MGCQMPGRIKTLRAFNNTNVKLLNSCQWKIHIKKKRLSMTFKKYRTALKR